MNGEVKNLNVKIPVLDESSAALFTSFFHILSEAHVGFSKLKLNPTPIVNAKGSMFDHIPAQIRTIIGNNYKMNLVTMKSQNQSKR